VTLNTISSGHYDDSFIDQLPRLLPIMSELDRRLLPLSKAIRRKYFRNVDLDEEDQFRPKYIEVILFRYISIVPEMINILSISFWRIYFTLAARIVIHVYWQTIACWLIVTFLNIVDNIALLTCKVKSPISVVMILHIFFDIFFPLNKKYTSWIITRCGSGRRSSIHF